MIALPGQAVRKTRVTVSVRQAKVDPTIQAGSQAVHAVADSTDGRCGLLSPANWGRERPLKERHLLQGFVGGR